GRVVRRGSGGPVAGVFVSPRCVDVDATWEDPVFGGIAEVRTDAEGRFEFERIATPTCSVEAWGDGWLRERQWDVALDGRQVVIELDPALSIEGAVTLDDGSPAAGTEVSVH